MTEYLFARLDDVEDADEDLQDQIDAVVANLAAHIADALDAHDASAISVLDAGGNYAAVNVETALAEVMDALEAHIADASDAHDASAISVLDTGGNYTATDVEAALAEVMDALQAHEADTSDAHDASAISVLDSGNNYTATNVETALAEVYDALEAHIADATAAHAASAISYNGGTGMSATDVEAAIDELATEKLDSASYTAADVLSKLLTVDGSGSGLDADLIDAKDSAQLFSVLGRSSTINYNDVAGMGIFWADGSSSTNGPGGAGNSGHILNFDPFQSTAPGEYVMQIADFVNKLYWRQETAGTYGSWYQFLTTEADVTFSQIAQLAGLSVLGVTGNSTADMAAITAGSDGQVLRRSGTALAFGEVATAGIADDAVTFAKIQNITSDRLLGRDTASSGNTEEITVGGGVEFTGSAGIQRSALTGDVTASAGSNSTTIPNDTVTYAKMQNISATSRILGRKTSGSGDTEECTLSEVLDFVGSAANGDMLYRTGGTWTRLPIGTDGDVLQVASSLPDWAAGGGGGDVILLTSGSVSNQATLDIPLTSYTSYRAIMIVLTNILPITDDVELRMQFSTNGGSSYDSSAGNYAFEGAINTAGAGGAFQGSGSSTFIGLCATVSAGNAVGNASADGISGKIIIYGQTNTAQHTRCNFDVAWGGASAGALVGNHGSGARITAQDTDAVRLLFESGNLSTGNYAVYGLV